LGEKSEGPSLQELVFLLRIIQAMTLQIESPGELETVLEPAEPSESLEVSAVEASPEWVVLKGTRHGLHLCLREEAPLAEVVSQIRSKLEEQKTFLDNASLSFDLGWRELDDDGLAVLLSALDGFNVSLAGVLSTSLQTRTCAEARGIKAIIGRLGLAQHQGRQLRQKVEPSEVEQLPPEASPEVSPPAKLAFSGEHEQEATLYIKRTLRSGQKACYPGNIVLWGDLNSGAELEADGDVLVLGTVRGRISAGAAGNEKAQIYCQSLQPTVLSIGSAVWTGESKSVKLPASVKVTSHKGQILFELSK